MAFDWSALKAFFQGLGQHVATGGRHLKLSSDVVRYAILYPKQVDELLKNADALVEAERQRDEAIRRLANVSFQQMQSFKAIPLPEEVKGGERPVLLGAATYKPSEYWSRLPANDATNIFKNWFNLDQLNQLDGWASVEQDWARLISANLVVFRGDTTSEVTVARHAYVRNIHPFILVARADRSAIPSGKDARSHVVGLFFRWVEMLTGRDLQTSFTVRRSFVEEGGDVAYVRGFFHFTGLRATEGAREKGDPAPAPTPDPVDEYWLYRELIVAKHGDGVVIVMTGVPQRDMVNQPDYRQHTRDWLSDFQLIQQMDGGLPTRSDGS